MPKHKGRKMKKGKKKDEKGQKKDEESISWLLK